MKLSLNLIFLFYVLLKNINSFIIGIDFGSEFYKIVLVKPGTPFSIVENIQSLRKTPTTLYIKDEERVYGLDAINKKIRNPQNTFVYPHDFLGRKFGDSEVKEMIEKYFVTYDIVEDTNRQSYQFKIKYDKKDLILSSEEVTGMLFRYIKFLSDKFSNSNIRDCVITVPVFFGYKQRLAIHQSAEIAGLNVLGIVNENLGAAIQYGLEKRFNKTENVIFYNMGSSYTQVSLVSFKTTEELNKATNKTFEYNTISVLGESWDNNLGGRDFNYKIIRHMMSLFDNLPQRKGKQSVGNNPKIVEKMLPASVKVKEILSANKDAYIQVLGVEDNLNLQDRLKRETFESFCEDELSRAYHPIERILNSTNTSLDNIEQVELIGGSIRIPGVQDRLREKIGSNKLGMHMNGDESVAFGTAFLAANLSSNFRTKRVDILHGLSYEIRIKLVHNLKENDTLCLETSDELAINCTRPLNKNTTIYKIRHGFDIARTVSFNHDSDFAVLIYEKFEDREENHIMTFNITNVKKPLIEAIAKGIKPNNYKVHLRFKLNRNGFLDLKPEITYENLLYFSEVVGTNNQTEYTFISNKTLPLTQEQLDEEYYRILESLKANLTVNETADQSNNSTSNSSESLNSTNTNTSQNTVNSTLPNVNDTYIFKMKKRIGEVKTSESRRDVKLQLTHSYPLPLNKKQLREAKEKLDQLDRNDELRLRTMERRNFLETFLYDKREWLESSPDAKKYLTLEEYENCSRNVAETKEWFEEDGFIAGLDLIEEKIKNVTSSFTNVIRRIEKFSKLFPAFERFEQDLNETMVNATNLLKYKPWINDSFNSNFASLHKEVSSWFSDIVSRQHQQNFTQDPLTSFETLELKMKSIKFQLRELNRIPMPKPQKIELNLKANETNSNETQNENRTINQETANKTEETLNRTREEPIKNEEL